MKHVKPVLNLQNEAHFKKSIIIVGRYSVSYKKTYEVLEEAGIKASCLSRWGRYTIVVTLEDEEQIDVWRLNKDKLKPVFVLSDRLDENGGPLRRFIWIEIKGLLPIAWTRATFKIFAELWGKLLCTLDITSKMNYFCKLMIETTSSTTIDEVVSVEIKNEVYQVIVQELNLPVSSDLDDDDKFLHGINRDASVKDVDESKSQSSNNDNIVHVSPKKAGLVSPSMEPNSNLNLNSNSNQHGVNGSVQMERSYNSNHEKAEASGHVLESFGEILPSNMEKVMETPRKDDDNVLRTQNLVPIARGSETHEQILPPFHSLSSNLIPPFQPQPLVVQSTFDNNKNTHKVPKKTDTIFDCHPICNKSQRFAKMLKDKKLSFKNKDSGKCKATTRDKRKSVVKSKKVLLEDEQDDFDNFSSKSFSDNDESKNHF